MGVMRTIILYGNQAFKTTTTTKQKVCFLICSRARAAKFLIHFFAVSAFLIPNFMGT